MAPRSWLPRSCALARMRIFPQVLNVPPSADEASLREFFAFCGTVTVRRPLWFAEKGERCRRALRTISPFLCTSVASPPRCARLVHKRGAVRVPWFCASCPAHTTTPFREQRIEFNGRELGPGEIARACTAAGGTQVCACVRVCVRACVRVQE